jgi:methyl-accepting chemotaxis protein
MKSQFSLKIRLAILSVIPLFCAVGLGTFLMMERIRELHQYTSFREVMNLANSLAEVNEANNAELGNAWCWTPTAVSENGIEVVQKIRDTWAENGRTLDLAYARLVAIRNRLDLSKYDPRVRTILDDVDAVKSKFPEHRQLMRQTLNYELIIVPYNELKNSIQALYPALLKETSDKELAQELTAYNLYLDYHAACVQYVGVMIWAHQIPVVPASAYARYESYYGESEVLLKHFRNVAPSPIVRRLDDILRGDQGRWVDEKVKSFLNTGDTPHDFSAHRELGVEFKAKAEARNVELGTIMEVIRVDIMNYTNARIEELAFNRNATIFLIVLAIGFTVGCTIYFGKAISRLIVNITHGIAEGANQVFAAAQQITEASESMAHSAAAQATSVGETLTMIERIRAMTQGTRVQTRKATAIIEENSKMAEESDKTMKSMSQSMVRIADNSIETKKILSTINNIAAQSNILALNAAVEAARLGTIGAAFAVVADEVRLLAQGSAIASRETDALVENSSQSIEQGTVAASLANESFARVLASTVKVSECIVKIDEDANKHAEAVAEMDRAANAVSDITQQNAASAQECAASAHVLNEQARSLRKYVRQLEAIVRGSS